MSLFRLVAAVLMFALIAPGEAAHAMTVSPTQVELISAGSHSRGQITVVNNSSVPLPVEAVIQSVSLDEMGMPKPVKTSDEFLVMPPQALIAPGATQNFRVQWLGDPMLAASQSYLLYMNQIPVKLPQGKSGVQIVMSMGVIINVAPPQGAPSLQIVDTGVTTDKQGKRHPTLTVQNPSKVHALLPQSTIRLTAAGWSTTLTPGMLNETIGIGLVQPGKRRKFVLPVELPAGVGSVRASLEMIQKR